MRKKVTIINGSIMSDDEALYASIMVSPVSFFNTKTPNTLDWSPNHDPISNATHKHRYPMPPNREEPASLS